MDALAEFLRRVVVQLPADSAADLLIGLHRARTGQDAVLRKVHLPQVDANPFARGAADLLFNAAVLELRAAQLALAAVRSASDVVYAAMRRCTYSPPPGRLRMRGPVSGSVAAVISVENGGSGPAAVVVRRVDPPPEKNWLPLPLAAEVSTEAPPALRPREVGDVRLCVQLAVPAGQYLGCVEIAAGTASDRVLLEIEVREPAGEVRHG